MNLIIILWVFYGMVITISFQTRFITMLSSPRGTTQISTLDAALSSNLSFYLREVHYKQFLNISKRPKLIEYNETYEILRQQIASTHSDEQFVAEVSFYSYCSYYDQILDSVTQKPLLMYITDTNMLYTFNILIVKRHPFFNVIDNAISQIHQYGHFIYFYKNVTKTVINRDALAHPTLSPLSLKQLILPFGVVVIGIFVSLLGFLTEVKYENNYTKK